MDGENAAVGVTDGAAAEGVTDGGPADEVGESRPAAQLADERPGGSGKLELLEREGEAAADYIEGLLDITDLDGDIDMDVEGSRAVVSVIGGGLEHLVGPEGKVLDALQELARLAVQRETGERSRLMLDVAGHRARIREELTKLGAEAAARVAGSGKPERLAPMTAFERKVVHDAVAEAGLVSESEGVEPDRRIVVRPAGEGVAGVAGGDSEGETR